MCTGVRGEPRPRGPIPRGFVAAKAWGFSVLGGVCVCVCVRACQPAQFCELVRVWDWESGILCISGCGGYVSKLSGMAEGGEQL